MSWSRGRAVKHRPVRGAHLFLGRHRLDAKELLACAEGLPCAQNRGRTEADEDAVDAAFVIDVQRLAFVSEARVARAHKAIVGENDLTLVAPGDIIRCDNVGQPFDAAFAANQYEPRLRFILDGAEITRPGRFYSVGDRRTAC